MVESEPKGLNPPIRHKSERKNDRIPTSAKVKKLILSLLQSFHQKISKAPEPAMVLEAIASGKDSDINFFAQVQRAPDVAQETGGRKEEIEQSDIAPVTRITETPPKATKEIRVLHSDQDTEAYASYSNFSEQFAIAKQMLEEHPEESVCLFLTHNETSTSNLDETRKVVTFHLLRKTDSGYAIQQIPAMHKIGWASRDNYDKNLDIFGRVLDEGFSGGVNTTPGEYNAILTPEGERDYFHWTRSSNIEEGDDYFLELWSSDLGSDEIAHAPALFLNAASGKHNVFSSIKHSQLQDITGVIVFPRHLTRQEMQERMDMYQQRFPNQQFTFLQRKSSSQVVERNLSSALPQAIRDNAKKFSEH